MVWVMAFTGIILKLFFTVKFKIVSLKMELTPYKSKLYLLMKMALNTVYLIRFLKMVNALSVLIMILFLKKLL